MMGDLVMPVLVSPSPTRAKFTALDAMAAQDQWGANCGPGALAGILGLTLEELRPHLGDFEAKRYTNPLLMWRILHGLERYGLSWSKKTRPPAYPAYGLARVQWEGPWTEPGVPMQARYRETHWIGMCCRSIDDVGVFDINAMDVGGWVALPVWSGSLVPWILDGNAKAYGSWHLTHGVEIKTLPILLAGV